MVSISDFVKRAFPDVPGCPYLVVQEAALDAIAQFCSETWLLRRAMATTVASINSGFNNQATISITSIVGTTFRPVGVSSLFIRNTPWELEELKVVSHIPRIAAVKDKKFYFFSDNQTLELFPMSLAPVDLTISITPLSTAIEVDDVLYDNWVESIVNGIKYRLFKMPKKTWTDLNSAAIALKEYNRGVVAARRQVHKSFTKQDLSVQPRSGVVWL
jgi:hypothetical protein